MKETLKYHTGLCEDDQNQLCRNFMLLILLSSLPCIGLSIYAWGMKVVLLFIASAVPGLATEYLFSRLPGRTFRGSSIAIAALLVLVLPAGTPAWMVSIATVFALFFGQEVFGGTGHQLVNPVFLAKLFLMISFLPSIQGYYFSSPPPAGDSHLWIVAGLLLPVPLILQLALRPSNLYLLAGAAAGTVLGILWMNLMDISPYESVFQVLLFDSFGFAVCFLLFDPANAPSGKKAMAAYGFIIAVLAFIIGTFSSRYSEGIVIALLFGNLLSPLLDQMFKSRKELCP